MPHARSAVKHFTRGGQTTLHNLRMFFQVMNQLAVVALVMAVITTALVAAHTVTAYERYVAGQYLWATTLPLLNDTATTDYREPNGEVTTVTYADIANAPGVNLVWRGVCRKGMVALLSGFVSGLVTLGVLSLWLRQRGVAQTDDTWLKGDSLQPLKVTRRLIYAKNAASDLQIATLPLIKHTETAHLLFHGTTGTGKSTAIKDLLDQIRQRGDRVILYDKSCNYLEEFYRPATDILLNPLDSRGQAWDLWRECRDSADFDSLAAAQIPMPLSAQDPFWVNAARTIFSAAAFEMRNDPKKSVMKLLQTLLTADLDSLQQYLRGTEAETLVSEKIEKTAISIKSVLATYLKSLKYVNESGASFSIRQWIQEEKAANWLFITSLGDRHETLKPLITAWLDIAVNALLRAPLLIEFLILFGTLTH